MSLVAVGDDAMTGRKVLHYRIDAPIGKGGMGEVVRATDTRLGRTVALKFLPDSLARDPSSRARFFVEAKAASRVSSPFVATLYDVGEVDGTAFLVMEYVEGEPLSERLKRGAFPVAEALAVATQIAQALAAAHERGVIHRDIKPSNVIIDRSESVKVLDFGLAKLFTPEKADAPTIVTPSLTAPGTIMGTFDYMSPEQALGEAVDHRTDIFSLGVVLYEMLCGVRPFRADTPWRLLDQIAHNATPALVGRAAHAPEAVVKIVRRALSKRPSDRYQTAREMAADLAAWTAPPLPPTDAVGVGHLWTSTTVALGVDSTPVPPRPLVREAVAVAPFVNVTRRPEDDWLGTAIAEAVAADLGRVTGLAVVERKRASGTIIRIRTSGPDASDSETAIASGQAFAAPWVVDGAFQRSGEQVRITARFADVATDAALRTIKIDGPVSEIFKLEDRIVEELCDGLDLELARSAISALAAGETQSVEAYRAYSRGLAELRAGDPEAFDRATAHLARAVELDPDYSRAWAALGSAYGLKGSFLAQRELVLEALDFERRALTIDPANALAHEWLGAAHLTLGNVEAAVAAAREALRLDPQRASALALHGRAYWLGRGMIEEGIRELERSTALDPNLGYSYLQLGHLYAITGDFERAEAASRRAVELEERNASGTLGLKIVGARTRLGYVFYRVGRYEEAVAEYLSDRRAVEAGSHGLRDRMLVEIDQKLGAAYLKLGREADAAECFDRVIASARERGARRPLDAATSYYVASAHALGGEAAPALEALAHAAASRPAFTAWRALRDPDLQALRVESEFRRLVAYVPGGDTLKTNVE
jgi:tetratricopeptide (TPR) repeat protein/predicted Ser/Thr protein kinase